MPLDPVAIGKKIQESYPQYAKVDPSVIGQKYLSKYGGAITGVQSGQIDIKDIPEKQRVGVSIGLEGAGYEPPKKQDTTKSSFDATTNFINILENRFGGAGGGEYEGAGARVSGAKKAVAGKIGLDEESKIYNDARKGFAATLKQLTGDTGVLTEQDYKRLANLLPTLGATPKEAQAKFADLRGQIASKFGGEAQPSGFQPPESKGGLVAAVAPETTKYFTETGPEFYKKGLPETYGKQLKEQLGLVPQAYKASQEIVAPFILLSQFKKLAGKSAIGSVNKAVKKRSVAAAESKAKISGDKLVKAGNKFVKNDPTAQNIANKVLPSLEKKSMSATQLLDKMKVWSKAYTAAGKTGKSAKAGLYDVLIREAKDQLKDKAPEVLNAHLQLAKKLGFRSNIRRYIYPAAIGTGVAAGIGLGVNKATGR